MEIGYVVLGLIAAYAIHRFVFNKSKSNKGHSGKGGNNNPPTERK